MKLTGIAATDHIMVATSPQLSHDASLRSGTARKKSGTTYHRKEITTGINSVISVRRLTLAVPEMNHAEIATTTQIGM